jgi:hypothetical protein
MQAGRHKDLQLDRQTACMMCLTQNTLFACRIRVRVRVRVRLRLGTAFTDCIMSLFQALILYGLVSVLSCLV